MEITDKNLIINYLSFCSVSPSLFFLLSTPVLGAKKKSARSLLNLKKKKKKGMVQNKQRFFGNDFLGSPGDTDSQYTSVHTDSQYTSVLRTWVFVLYLKVPEL